MPVGNYADGLLYECSQEKIIYLTSIYIYV